MSITDDLREKYLPYQGIATADQILRLCEEHERMRNFLLRLQGQLQVKDEEQGA